jgi:hypothetical protein
MCIHSSRVRCELKQGRENIHDDSLKIYALPEIWVETTSSFEYLDFRKQ